MRSAQASSGPTRKPGRLPSAGQPDLHRWLETISISRPLRSRQLEFYDSRVSKKNPVRPGIDLQLRVRKLEHIEVDGPAVSVSFPAEEGFADEVVEGARCAGGILRGGPPPVR